MVILFLSLFIQKKKPYYTHFKKYMKQLESDIMRNFFFFLKDFYLLSFHGLLYDY
jgi:hypothetical protein